jgi:predicted 3-demethylubiquinone-9 3-methyltransferase (glyoxalase superfamily)
MQKITPNLWFNGNAKEAVDFYVSVFPKSKILSTEYYPKSTEDGLAPFQKKLAGQVLTIEFELNGVSFVAINAGSEFKPNPSISFFVNFDPSKDTTANESLDKLWNELMDGGKILMPLQEYPFSKHYGWVEDRFGVSWQLILTNPEGEVRPFIVPSLMFVGENAGKAEEATDFYFSVFKDSQRGILARYPEGSGVDAGTLMYTDFRLEKTWLAAMDSAEDHKFQFTEGVSLSISCEDQEEIDYFWKKLSTVSEAEQCGWCKDKYGVSWQVVPKDIGELMKKPNAFSTMMQQKKIVIDEY